MKQATRWQAIKYDRNGSAYVKHYGRRYHLDEFMRVLPGQYVNGIEVHGSLNILCGLAVGIHISADGETAKVFYFD
ncbi:hypothetical protein [Cloacibacillus porcorum]